LLEALGETAYAAAVQGAVRRALQDGVLSADLGGSASTEQVKDAVIAHLTREKAIQD
jgi:homoisocitrate dehydrogenase